MDPVSAPHAAASVTRNGQHTVNEHFLGWVDNNCTGCEMAIVYELFCVPPGVQFRARVRPAPPGCDE